MSLARASHRLDTGVRMHLQLCHLATVIHPSSGPVDPPSQINCDAIPFPFCY